MENITREEGKDAVFECLGEGVPKPTMSIRRESSNENMIDNPVLYFPNSRMSVFIMFLIQWEAICFLSENNITIDES